MYRAYLGLGTNMGDREGYLTSACKMISEHNKINILNQSKVYETKAWGLKEQDDFLNLCIEIQTILTPYELLDVCQNIENKLHRVRNIRWGPRTIDVDILFYEDEILNDEDLVIPHPRIEERAFVLIPLMDLNEDLKIKDKPISYYLDKLSEEEKKEVKLYE